MMGGLPAVRRAGPAERRELIWSTISPSEVNVPAVGRAGPADCAYTARAGTTGWTVHAARADNTYYGMSDRGTILNEIPAERRAGPDITHRRTR